MKLPEPSGGSYELCPSGNHLAVCNRVIDLGTQRVEYEGQVKMQRKIYIGWVIPAELMEDGRPFGIGKRYTFSTHEKSAMRKDLESWRGKAFKPEELGVNGTFEIQNLINKGCFLSVVHVTREQKTFANISAVASLPKGMTAPTGDWDAGFLSLDEAEFDVNMFDAMSDKMKETIASSPEYKALSHAGGSLKSYSGVPNAAVYDQDNEIPF